MNCQTPHHIAGHFAERACGPVSCLPGHSHVSQAPGSGPGMMHKNNRMGARKPCVNRRVFTSSAAWREANFRGGGKEDCF